MARALSQISPRGGEAYGGPPEGEESKGRPSCWRGILRRIPDRGPVRGERRGDMSDDLVLLEEKDGVGTLTLNRPEKLNAMSPLVLAAFDERLAEAASDDAIKVLVIRGAGRSFSSGYDLTRPADQTLEADRLAPSGEPGALAAHPRPAQTGDRHDPRPLPRGGDADVRLLRCHLHRRRRQDRLSLHSRGRRPDRPDVDVARRAAPRQVHVVPSRQPDIGKGRRGVRLRDAGLRPRRA